MKPAGSMRNGSSGMFSTGPGPGPGPRRRSSDASSFLGLAGLDQSRSPSKLRPGSMNPSAKEAAKFDKSAAAREELDKLLQTAVKEYEEDFALKEQEEETARAGEDFKAFTTRRRSAQMVNQMKEKGETKATETMQKILEDLRHPEYGESLQNTLKILSGNMEGYETVEQLRDSLFKKPAVDPEKAAEGRDMDYVVASTLHDMSKIPQDMAGMEPAGMEQTGEDIMNGMIAEFERLGEKEDYNSFIENNLRQLLSKEVMYIPVKQICDKYPEWLAIQEDHLSPEEYQRFGRQYQHFQKMVATYQTEPDNFPRLMEIMYDIQEFGQPPADIIKELAPGLEFNEEGLPVIPNVGGNTMPHMPNVPFPEAQQCTVS